MLVPFGWMLLLWLQSSRPWPIVAPWLIELARWLPGWLPPDKLIHAGLYGVLSALWLWARPAPSSHRHWWWQAALLASTYGALDEWHQTWVPGRDGDWPDWLADSVGATLTAYALHRYTRNREDGKREIQPV